MKRHLFLTGEPGTGKSTLLGRLLPPDVQLCGFVTERHETARGAGVYLNAASGERRYGPENRVGTWADGGMRACPGVFDTLGVELLSRLAPDCPVIMDELGFLEQGAPLFCARVLELLDGSRPVFGVIKNRPGPFLDAVRDHPAVEVVLVSKRNRDELYDKLKNGMSG